MATFDYQTTLATAKRLLLKFGNPVKLTRAFDESLWDREYDPVTETFIWRNTISGQTQSTEPSDTEYTDNGVLVGISDSLLENSLVNKSDSELLIVDIPEPQVDDVFIVNGKSYKYIAHESINPAGTVLLYKIALRI
jgi:hypothetical protein